MKRKPKETPEFIYRMKIRECLAVVDRLKQERDYEKFVEDTTKVIDKWNRVLSNKSRRIGDVYPTF